MKHTLLVAAIAASLAPGINHARAADTDALRQSFAHPSRDFSTGPLWTWNDMLTEEQVRASLRDLAAQHVRQVWVHPRPGLMTPYLAEDWFRMWSVSLDEAAKLDMNVWIYDENSYPSGFAGGLVPAALPDSRSAGLRASETPGPPVLDTNVVAVFQLVGANPTDVTPRIRAGEDPGPGPYLAISRVYAPSNPWFGGKWYVDLLRPGVTEKFLEITLEPYRKRFGAEFGKRIPGSFTDEPNLFVPHGLPWTDDLPAQFKKRWGYDLPENLPGIFRPVGDWRRTRHNFFQTVLDLFVDRWARPYHDYCEKHGLEFTGHYWEHGWPGIGHCPDSMAMYAWHQRPAIDILFNQYKEDTNGQFGNVRSVRELASVANQTGARRTLCETYGGGGWDLRFEDMKRIGDWIYALGVNTLNEHISPVTMRGARKRDYPQFFTAHEPWWDAYHTLEDYFTRLSLALSSGKQANRILILEPTTTAWLHQTDFDPSQKPALDALGKAFFDLLMGLERAQVAYDIGSEYLLAHKGSVEGRLLRVGAASYETIVIPPLTENLNKESAELLARFAANGGALFGCGRPPTLLDGRPSDVPALLAESPGWKSAEPVELPGLLASRQGSPLAIRRADADPGQLFQHRRVLDDGQLLFLINTSIEQPSRGTVDAAGLSGVQQWDPHTGDVSPAVFRKTAAGASLDFDLPPCGSTLLLFSNKPIKPRAAPIRSRSPIAPAGPMRARRLQPNVLTLDFVDATAGGQTLRAAYCPAAGDFIFKIHGLPGDPWNRGVQFRDELITRTFPPDSGLEASYRFKIDGPPPRNLSAVIERSDLYAIECNGRAVKATAGASWVEPAFHIIDIAAVASSGENTLTLRARPLTIYHEVEPAYLLGDFTLKPADSGFTIVSSDNTLSNPTAKWNAAGLPLYGHDVAYTQTFPIDKPSGRYCVALGDWNGSVARVVVNGKPTGYIGWRPYELDVTAHIRPGGNTVDVVVSGTLKNTFGPHHCGGLRGIASPGHFSKGPKSGPPPAAQYDTIGYGLFEPFLLSRQP